MRLTDGDSAEILSMPVDTLLMNQWNNTDFMSADVRQFLSEEHSKLALVDTDDEDDLDQKPSIDFDDLLLTTTTTTTTTISNNNNNNINSNNNNNNNNINNNNNNNHSNGATVVIGSGGGGINTSNHHNNHNATANVSVGVHHAVNNSLAELKPLPPFTGYTGQLIINGISGHHYHTIATAPNSTRVMIESNNHAVDTTNPNNNVPYYSTDHVVSSSTMDTTIDSIKSESNVMDYDLPSDDLAALIGSAMADTTCAKGDDSSDSWLDLEAWIHGNYAQSTSPTSSRPNVGNGSGGAHSVNHSNGAILCPDTLHDFVTPTQSQFAVTPTPSQVIAFHAHLKAPTAQPPSAQPPQPPPPPPPPPHRHSQQAQHQQQQHHQQQQQQREINTTFSHMPLLQNRLQNGPPKTEPQDIGYNIVSECPSPSSSTPYLAHSPPCHVVSTSDIGFIQVNSSTRPSPELQVSFPHTTTPSKKSRSRTKSKMNSNIVYNEGNLGKEKTVHRCNICNRGFLNKSNIKVHLRTHTGEKPFRCDTCGKAFRQKAHLIKHAQIHKREENENEKQKQYERYMNIALQAVPITKWKVEVNR